MEQENEPLTPAVLEKLNASYKKGLPGKVQMMEKLLAELLVKPSFDTFKDLRFLIHKMAGSAGTFGFPELSTLCKEEDNRLKAYIDKVEVPEDLTKTGELIVRIKRMLRI